MQSESLRRALRRTILSALALECLPGRSGGHISASEGTIDDPTNGTESNVTLPRRMVLAAGASGLLGTTTVGCLSHLPGGYSRSAHDLFVHNETDGKRRVSVTVTDANDGTEQINDTATIEPNGTKKYNNQVFGGQTVEVTVRPVDGYAASCSWVDVSEAFHVRIRANEIAMREESK